MTTPEVTVKCLLFAASVFMLIAPGWAAQHLFGSPAESRPVMQSIGLLGFAIVLLGALTNPAYELLTQDQIVRTKPLLFAARGGAFALAWGEYIRNRELARRKETTPKPGTPES